LRILFDQSRASDDHTLQGNKAEPVISKTAPTHIHGDLKEAMSGSPSSDGVSIDEQSDDESASSGDEVDDETAESDLRPYIFSSEGRTYSLAS